ncbi:MAG: Fe-S cluster assembly sulfur transfer protein SufU [Spirochaetota bacterium]
MNFNNELYKEIILEHYKSPTHKKDMEDADLKEEGVNRSCGDEIMLYVKLDGDIIKEVSYNGIGCAISQASASMLTEAIEGKKIDEVKNLITKFKGMLLENKEPDFPDESSDLESLQGVKDYPVRIKCALLSWETLEQMLEEIQNK